MLSSHTPQPRQLGLAPKRGSRLAGPIVLSPLPPLGPEQTDCVLRPIPPAADITQRFTSPKKGAFKPSSFVNRVTPRRMHQPYAAHFTIKGGEREKVEPTGLEWKMQWISSAHKRKDTEIG